MVGLILLAELVLVLGVRVVGPGALAAPAAPIPDGRLRHHQHRGARAACSTPSTSTIFQGAGLILLVAMIGAIVLTLRHKAGVKRQSIAAQVARRPATAIEIVKVASGGSIIPGAVATSRRG